MRSGFDTGLDRDAIVAAATWVGGLLERTPPAMVGRAGAFPPVAQSQRGAA